MHQNKLKFPDFHKYFNLSEITVHNFYFYNPKQQIMNLRKICVCGAGTMGSSIAQSAAQAGHSVLLYEQNETVLNNAKINIQKNLDYLVQKEKLSTTKASEVFNNIYFITNLLDCNADFFIEAIIENKEAKINLFNQLANINKSDCVFATNTSSLSVSAIAEKIQHPERVIGMHFFNPATIMKLVEVVQTPFTNTETKKITIELAQSMNKTAVLCKDAPGFIVNHVARPYYIEALRLKEETDITFEQIDRILEATGFKLGPFRLMDLIGNDINYAVSCSVYEQMNQPERLKPSYIQKQIVTENKLGKKTGAGYYNYS